MRGAANPLRPTAVPTTIPGMAVPFHGTRRERAKRHPVFELAFWEPEFPLGDERRELGWVNGPAELAEREQACRLAAERGKFGPSVPSDVFARAEDRYSDKPLTRLGGIPWRETSRAWPIGDDGWPLVFLGQISFVDSSGLLPFAYQGVIYRTIQYTTAMGEPAFQAAGWKEEAEEGVNADPRRQTRYFVNRLEHLGYEANLVQEKPAA